MKNKLIVIMLLLANFAVGATLVNMPTIQNKQSMETASISINGAFANIKTLNTAKLEAVNGIASYLTVNSGLTINSGGITLGGVTKTSWLQEAMTKSDADALYVPLTSTNVMWKSVYSLGAGSNNASTVDHALWANSVNVQNDSTFSSATSNTVASSLSTKTFVNTFTTNFNLSNSVAGDVLKFDGTQYVHSASSEVLQPYSYSMTNGGTITITKSYGNLIRLVVTNSAIIGFDGSYLSNGVNRLAIEIYPGTNSITLSSASINTNFPLYLTSNTWNSVYFRKNENTKWDFRQ